jgi:hypothetical protein
MCVPRRGRAKAETLTCGLRAPANREFESFDVPQKRCMPSVQTFPNLLRDSSGPLGPTCHRLFEFHEFAASSVRHDQLRLYGKCGRCPLDGVGPGVRSDQRGVESHSQLSLQHGIRFLRREGRSREEIPLHGQHLLRGHFSLQHQLDDWRPRGSGEFPLRGRGRRLRDRDRSDRNTTGKLSAVANSRFHTGLDPSSVTVDPSGKFVYVANTADSTVSACMLDGSSGALTQVANSPFPSGGNGTINGPSGIVADASVK